MADGSAVAVNAVGDAHALNPDAVSLWPVPALTFREMSETLESRGIPASDAPAMAERFIEQLSAASLVGIEAA